MVYPPTELVTVNTKPLCAQGLKPFLKQYKWALLCEPCIAACCKVSQALRGSSDRVCGGVGTSCDRKSFLQNSSCNLTVLVTPLRGRAFEGCQTAGPAQLGHTCLRVGVSISNSINEDNIFLKRSLKCQSLRQVSKLEWEAW